MSNPHRGGRRTPPYVFTEQGVTMLSSVLRSDQAVSVNIEIMRAFVALRRAIATNEELARQLSQLELGNMQPLQRAETTSGNE